MGLLSIHPSAPHRPYLSWQRKVRIQLDSLLEIPNPDVRTRGEITVLRSRLKRSLRNLEIGWTDGTRKCSATNCHRRVHINDRHKQCAICRSVKTKYERIGRRKRRVSNATETKMVDVSASTPALVAGSERSPTPAKSL